MIRMHNIYPCLLVNFSHRGVVVGGEAGCGSPTDSSVAGPVLD